MRYQVFVWSINTTVIMGAAKGVHPFALKKKKMNGTIKYNIYKCIT